MKLRTAVPAACLAGAILAPCAQAKISCGKVTTKSVKLKKLSVVGATDVSKATFRSRIRHGKQVRMLMKSKQAGPCYVGNHSNTTTS